MKFQRVVFLLIAFLFCFSNDSFTQDYFQQQVNYKIKVSLDDSVHSLSAFEEIEYINNSPDELSFIWFHLWPNGYSNSETALAKQMTYSAKYGWFENEKTRGFIDSLDFKVDGERVKWEYDKKNIDICKLILNEPVKPGESVTITTPFYVKIPSGYLSRLGHIEQAYTITQWYPKPAVYDKYGWHPFPYLNQGEFYSEFGSFDVSITVPENYVVAATGNLQTDSELVFLNELAGKTASIKDFDFDDNDFPPSAAKTKTVRYTEKNIHDFAWFADKRFYVLKSEVKLPHTGRTVSTWVYFPNSDADLWKKTNEYINDAIYYYSLWYGDYPYNNCTAVLAPLSAGGGMEYPTITVIGGSMGDMDLEVVIMHEVGHNWFYGMLGSNERDYAWMDEGLNSFSESRYMMTKYPDNRLYKMGFQSKGLARFLGVENLQYNSYHYLSYLTLARENKDQPMSLTSNKFTGMNYGAVVYGKTAAEFQYLHGYFGEEKFNTIMQDYFNTWKFRHPYPDDLQKIFEEHSGKNMSWFFDDIVKTTKKIDYKISRFKNGKVLIKTKQQIQGPVSICGLYGDSVVFEKWVDGFEGRKWVDVPANDEINKLKIDCKGDIPELHRSNNTLRTKGIFRKVKPLKFRIISPVENPEYTSINLFPVIGWNNYNKFMLGGVLYSSPVPSPRLEYQIMPVYSFGSGDLAGMGKIRYNILPYNKIFRKISVYLAGRQYAFENKKGSYYQKLALGADFYFRKKDLKRKVSGFVNLEVSEATDLNSLLTSGEYSYKTYYSGRYHYNNNVHLPFEFTVSFDGSDDFLKSSLTLNYHIPYSYKKGLDIRFFGGAFLFRTDDLSSVYDFALSGVSGVNDYDYDGIFLGRFENPSGNNFLSKQFMYGYGGFGLFTTLGNSNSWLTSLNINAAVPRMPSFLPVSIYANVAMTRETVVPENSYKTEVYYDIGAKLNFGDIFEIYFPAYASKSVWDNSNAMTDNYWQKIRFSIYLDPVNPFTFIQTMF
jgi:hypothetical protein